MAGQPAAAVEITVQPTGPFYRVLCSRHGYIITAGDHLRASIEVLGHAAAAHARVGAGP